MSRDKAIKSVLKLIMLILERHSCKITKHGEQWQWQSAGNTQLFDDQLEAVLHGCGQVIPLNGGRS